MWGIIRRKGFTLIELLVAIGLLAILSAFAFSIIGQGPRQFARDSKRKSDLENIRSALEAYRNDQGYYPTSFNYSCTGALPCLAPTYISALPTDPLSTGSYIYVYSPSGTCGTGACTYTLSDLMEHDPAYPTPTPYIVTNP